MLSSIDARAEALVRTQQIEAGQLCSVLRALGGARVAHFQLAVAATEYARQLLAQQAATGAQAVELLYHCTQQGSCNREVAQAALDLAAAADGAMATPADAARVLVVAYGTVEHEKQEGKLSDHALVRKAHALVQGRVGELDDASALALAAVAASAGGDEAAFATALRQELQRRLPGLHAIDRARLQELLVARAP